MTVDVNAYLGHYAFRRLRHNTPDALLRLMDSKGIPRLHSVECGFYSIQFLAARLERVPRGIEESGN